MYLLFFIFINLLLIVNYSSLKKIYRIKDFPDSKRKFHKIPMPLLGGLVIYINFFLFFLIGLLDSSLTSNILFSGTSEYLLFFFIASSFFLLGAFDDRFHINANLKLIIMILLVSIAIFFDDKLIIQELKFSFYSEVVNLKKFSFFFSILCFLLFINSLNMLDGINGQASTYAIFLFTFLLLNLQFVLLIYVFIISIIFFLYLNFTNKSFLGDSGTLFLGYVISYLFIKFYNANIIKYSEEIFLIMSIAGYELLRLAIFRIIKKKHPFSSDRNHIHHIFLKKISFTKTYFLIQLLLIFPYVIFFCTSNFFISFFISLSCYIILIILFKKIKYKSA
jgi:UDP-N-acetylmuramyl pentapeptide phosphotransferase/UDP-N-acetylglucosamine-1-phosphate transferase